MNCEDLNATLKSLKLMKKAIGRTNQLDLTYMELYPTATGQMHICPTCTWDIPQDRFMSDHRLHLYILKKKDIMQSMFSDSNRIVRNQ